MKSNKQNVKNLLGVTASWEVFHAQNEMNYFPDVFHTANFRGRFYVIPTFLCQKLEGFASSMEKVSTVIK